MIDHLKLSPVDSSQRERLPEHRDPSLRLLAILVGVVGVMAVVSAL